MDAPRWAPSRAELAELADHLVSDSIEARFHSREDEFRKNTAMLAEMPGVTDWRQTVERSLMAYLQRGVTIAWQQGWQPADVVRLIGRDLTRRHVRIATDAIAAEMRSYTAATVDERWQAQLTAIDARVWWETDKAYWGSWRDREGVDHASMITCAVEVLCVLATLPQLQRLCPLPGTARRTVRRPTAHPVNERTLTRIRALLAKAEATDFPAEAETFSTAAQALMARHSIDNAMLAVGPDREEEPQGRRLGIDAPYEGPKALLLEVVASANRCRSVWSNDLGFATVLGFPADLDAVELLFTSLLVQATSAMVREGSRQYGNGRSRTRSFRQSFLTSYAARIGERLEEATGEAVEQAIVETGSAFLPVLAARDRAVDEAVETMFPSVTERSVSPVHDHEGWVSGRAAADLATMHSHTKITEART